MAIFNESSKVILCHSVQKQFQIQEALLMSGRQSSGLAMRPDNYPDRFLSGEMLFRAVTSHSLLRHRNKQAFHFSHKQLQPLCAHHCSTLQGALAGGAIFQMDKTTPSYQSVLWYLRERGKNSDLDSSIGLRSGSYLQKGIQARS